MSKLTKFHHLKDDGSYEVGYGKPPKATQFRKGQSGNPQGRRRTSQHANALMEWENPLRKYLLEDIQVVMKGKKVRLPVIEALIMSAIRKALEGSTRHLKILLDGSDGLKALVHEQKRQCNSADLAYMEAVRDQANQWARELEEKKTA